MIKKIPIGYTELCVVAYEVDLLWGICVGTAPAELQPPPGSLPQFLIKHNINNVIVLRTNTLSSQHENELRTKVLQ